MKLLLMHILIYCRAILQDAYVCALDAEWQPCYKASQKPNASLVQLAVRTGNPIKQYVLLLVSMPRYSARECCS